MVAAVVLRLFSEALSLNGRIKAIKSKFLNKIEYSSVKSLEEIWASKEKLELSYSDVFALIANEFAHGNIARRPWMAILNNQSRAQVLDSVFVNLGYLYLRVDKVGQEQTPIVRALAYLVLSNLEYMTPKNLKQLLMMHI